MHLVHWFGAIEVDSNIFVYKVVVVKRGVRRPVLAATVHMPPTDPMMLPFDKIQANQADNDWDKEMA